MYSSTAEPALQVPVNASVGRPAALFDRRVISRGGRTYESQLPPSSGNLWYDISRYVFVVGFLSLDFMYITLLFYL